MLIVRHIVHGLLGSRSWLFVGVYRKLKKGVRRALLFDTSRLSSLWSSSPSLFPPCPNYFHSRTSLALVSIATGTGIL